MARLPKTVMQMAPAINEYMATRTPGDLSFSGQDPFPYSEQSMASYIKARTHGNFSEREHSTFISVFTDQLKKKKYRRLKEDNYTEIFK